MRRRSAGILDRREIVAMYRAGIKTNRIAELDGVTPTTVRHHLAEAEEPRQYYRPLMLSDTESAWLAGLIDGEGCLSVTGFRRKSDDRRAASLHVRMCHKETIERVCELTGVGRAGKTVPKNPNHRPFWTWGATGRSIVPVLQMCMPYFVTKREHAALILDTGDGYLSPEQARRLKGMNSSKGFGD